MIEYTKRHPNTCHLAHTIVMDKSSNNSNSWTSDIRKRFPDWKTESAAQRWPEVKAELQIGQSIKGQVIARAPFGVWLDIGVSLPALLLVPNMKDAKVRRIGFEDYPVMDALVDGRINALGNEGEIGVTQQNPDEMIEGQPSA